MKKLLISAMVVMIAQVSVADSDFQSDSARGVAARFKVTHPGLNGGSRIVTVRFSQFKGFPESQVTGYMIAPFTPVGRLTTNSVMISNFHPETRRLKEYIYFEYLVGDEEEGITHHFTALAVDCGLFLGTCREFSGGYYAMDQDGNSLVHGDFTAEFESHY